MGLYDDDIAKMAATDEDWGLARSHSTEADTQFKRSIDRMENWPQDVQVWIRGAQQEMEKMADEAKSKM